MMRKRLFNDGEIFKFKFTRQGDEDEVRIDAEAVEGKNGKKRQLGRGSCCFICGAIPL
jgi:hypothetical protein